MSTPGAARAYWEAAISRHPTHDRLTSLLHDFVRLENWHDALPVANRPFLSHMLANLARHGVEEAILTTGYLAKAFDNRIACAAVISLVVLRVISVLPAAVDPVTT